MPAPPGRSVGACCSRPPDVTLRLRAARPGQRRR
jgi:hypothetical protein